MCVVEGQRARKRKGPARAEHPYGRVVRVKVKGAGPGHGDDCPKK